MIKWSRSWDDQWEGLPVDVLPVSNGEFIPPPPSKEQLAIMRLQDQEVERWRRKVRHEPPAVRADFDGDGDRFLGDRRWLMPGEMG